MHAVWLVPWECQLSLVCNKNTCPLHWEALAVCLALQTWPSYAAANCSQINAVSARLPAGIPAVLLACFGHTHTFLLHCCIPQNISMKIPSLAYMESCNVSLLPMLPLVVSCVHRRPLVCLCWRRCTRWPSLTFCPLPPPCWGPCCPSTWHPGAGTCAGSGHSGET